MSRALLPAAADWKAVLMSNTWLVASSVVLSMAGCSSPANSSRESAGSQGSGAAVEQNAGGGQLPGAAGHMDGVFYVEDGAPDPRHCAVDSECLGDTVTVANGCCVESSTPVPQTHRYHEWLSAHRMMPACRALDCPIVPPQMPAACAFEMRCAAGQCTNTCP